MAAYSSSIGSAIVADQQGASPPSVVVAHTMRNEPAPLGLDRPLRILGGGDRLMPSGMPLAPGIDHVPGLRRFVAQACRASFLAGGTGYHQPPLALLGERGGGKGHVAAWIARNAGLPLFRMPVSAIGTLVGPATGTDVHPMPPLPIVAVAAGGCANPIVVIEVDAKDPPNDDAVQALATMLDPRRNTRIIVETLGIIVDLGSVSWIVEVQARPVKRGGVAHPHAVPYRPAVLPDRLVTLFEEVGGSQFVLNASRDLKDLRRIDVAAAVCSARRVDDGSLVRAVHERLVALERQHAGDQTFEVLVGWAEGALADDRRLRRER